ncbi:hypothetical protein ILYODFUR_036496 [Ilyodon furcidens]|uniref:Uncharacterized protein n=1 Tax=Ilyodon furcidens TaxID=33524 RepID=A0ABV0SSH1_9TELE
MNKGSFILSCTFWFVMLRDELESKKSMHSALGTTSGFLQRPEGVRTKSVCTSGALFVILCLLFCHIQNNIHRLAKAQGHTHTQTHTHTHTNTHTYTTTSPHPYVAAASKTFALSVNS